MNDFTFTFTLSYVINVTNSSSPDAETSEPIDVMTVIHSVIATVGIIGNIIVVIVFLTHRRYRKKIPNIFIINQSLLDFSVSVVLLLTTVTIRDTHSIKHKGTIGTIQCLLWNTKFLLWGLFVSSTWNIVSLTFERYLELVHTMWHKTNFKTRWIYISFAINWVFGVGLNAAYMIPTTKVISGRCLVYTFWPSLLFSSAFGVFLIFIQFIIPLIILVYCYGRIVLILTTRIDTNLDNVESLSQRNIHNLKGKTPISTSKDKFQLARKNTIKTFLLVGVCFIICWSNNQVYYLMYNLGYEVDWNSTYYQFTVLMVFLNCTINPFIYLVKYDDYQRALRKIFGCEKRSQSNESEMAPSNNSVEVDISVSVVTKDTYI